MAGKTAILAVRIVSDAKQFKSGMDGATSKLDAFKSKVGKLALPATAILGGLAVVGKKFVDLAANAEQMQGGMQAVFSKASADVDKFAKTSADRLGLSGASYNQLAAQIGTGLKGAGVPLDKLAGQTDDLMTKAADFSSVFGGSTTDAVSAFSSAMKGNYEQMERYGVNMTASMITDRLKEKGLDKLTGAALAQAKQQEALAIINEQAAQYTGNFAKEAGTLSGQQERLAAKFENLGTTLGTFLLPFLTQVATKFGEVISWVQQNASTVAVLAGVLGGLAAAVLVVNGAMTAYVAVQSAVKAAIAAATVVQTVWNAVMAANPVMLIVIAIAALVAGIILAYNNIGWFKDGVNAALSFIGELAGTVAQWFSDVWTSAVDWVSGVVAKIAGFFSVTFAAAKVIVSTVVAAVKSFLQSMSDKANAGIEGVKGFFQTGFAAAKAFVVSAIDSAKTTIQGISDKVSKVIEAIKGFFEAGFAFAGSVVDGAISGITGAIDGISSAVQGAIGWVQNLFNMDGAPGWLKGILGMGGTGFDFPTGTAFSVPMTAPVGIGATGGLSLAKSFSGGNAPRRTNKAADGRNNGLRIVQNVYASEGMSARQIGDSAARELMFRYDALM